MRNIAHRGASAYAPENTVAAFDLAIAMGADAIETDVQSTSDGHLVLFHDSLLDRTSNGHGLLTDQALGHLQQLDIGAWFSPDHAGTRILELEPALDRFLSKIPFVLEIKDPAAALPLMDAIPRTDRIEITSFDWDALLLARDRAPAYRFGFLTTRFDTAEIERCVAAGLQQICPHASSVSANIVAEAHRQGLDVRAWGVSERLQIDRLRDAGVDGTTCNWPDWLRGAQEPIHHS